ncbi:unnamed protein product [Amaranthus hypochondriacus]
MDVICQANNRFRVCIHSIRYHTKIPFNFLNRLENPLLARVVGIHISFGIKCELEFVNLLIYKATSSVGRYQSSGSTLIFARQ